MLAGGIGIAGTLSNSDVQERAEAERAEAERLEAERAEAERLEAERKAQLAEEWANIVNARPDLNEEWETLRDEGNRVWAAARNEVNMILGLVRPGIPAREAVVALMDKYPAYVEAVATWVKETHAERAVMDLNECVAVLVHSKALAEMEELWPTISWFGADGEPIEQLVGLGDYVTREEWLEEATLWPSFSEEEIRRIVELGGGDPEASS